MTTRDEVHARLSGAVRDAFIADNEARARPAHQMGLSRLGGCRRAGAYALAGTEPSDTPERGEGRAASLGTWIHEGLLPTMVKVLGPTAACEQRVTLHAAGLVLNGRLDLIVDDVLMDLKTGTDWRLQGVRIKGSPYSENRMQVMAYALAARQAGMTINWIAWLYMGRERGDEEIIVERFDDKVAIAVIERAAALRRFAADPDKAPRDGRGPGLAFACDECPWLRRCWGPTAKAGTKGAQTALAAEGDESVRRILLALMDAQARRTDANREVEFLRAALPHTKPGVYGEVTVRRGARRTVTDWPAIRRILAEAGYPDVPTTKVPGTPLVRLDKAMSKKMRTQLADQIDDGGDLTSYDQAPPDDDETED